MQTFLPYADFKLAAKVLDYRRLGKQRIEAWQIYLTLQGERVGKRGWQNQPAVLMWQGHEKALLLYGITICREWKSRGYKDTMEERFLLLLDQHKGKKTRMPPWLGDERVHKSHRANLKRKDPAYYGQFGWKERPMQEYFWPVAAQKSRRA
jgi:hypothetical protein